ncbi:MAG: peptidase [Candidatus Terraquivivens tikiterensis]|uniref:Peptidase n=1 Tax=Candidatus Terraquivivens tikiterensis TaxID=1980982 RepID=A0A2R7Y5B0_9ARCH|nr:MAG: peptidase [Candidatus Terraquivivens tikiterensis]
MVRVLMVIGDAAEAQETFYPYWRLKEEGFEVHVAAPSKKVVFTVVHDFEPGWETYTEKPGYRFGWVDMAFKDVDPTKYDGLYITGGRAPEYIRTYPELQKIVKHFFDTNKPVAAICHGPLIITAYGLAKGRKMTAYGVLKADVEGAGATYLDQEVVVDGNLITSRAWPDLPAIMREFIKKLKK